MKKLVLIFVIFAIVCTSAFAQDLLNFPPPVKGGNILMDIGFGLGNVGYWDGFDGMIIPPLYFQVEYALPVGVPLSVGGKFAISMNEDRWKTGGKKYGYRYTNLAFAGRVNWHWNFPVDWLDFYTGVAMGYSFPIVTRIGSSGKYKGKGYNDFLWTLQAGAHFYFTEKVGLNVEAGYPYWLKAGLALKF